MKLPEYKVSLHITHNQHKSYYESADSYLTGDGGYCSNEWLSREDYDAAITLDSIWEIQWYPNTPVCFCTAKGSTFENALKVANQEG